MLRSTITAARLLVRGPAVAEPGILAVGSGDPARGPSTSVRVPRPSQQSLDRALRIARSKPFRVGLTVCLSLVGAAAVALTVRHFITHGWPLAHADPLLVVAAAA